MLVRVDKIIRKFLAKQIQILLVGEGMSQKVINSMHTAQIVKRFLLLEVYFLLFHCPDELYLLRGAKWVIS